MTKEDIIRIARDAGSIDSEETIEIVWSAFTTAEREACAKICDDIENEAYETYRQKYDTYTEGLADGANACLEAIRARK